MLIKMTIESNSKKFNDTGSAVLVAELMNEAETVETSKSRFKYPLCRRDRRVSPSTIVTTEGIAAIKTAIDLAYNANYIDLPIFEDNLSTRSTTTYTFSVTDLVYFLPDNSSSTTRSWAFISVGAFKVVKYLVDYNLDQIIDIATTGSTTTTTTTTV
jgi:hypothetical protein